MDQHNELAQAALNGINEYLRTTRGAQAFGAGAKGYVNDKNEIVIVHNQDDTTIFRPITF